MSGVARDVFVALALLRLLELGYLCMALTLLDLLRFVLRGLSRALGALYGDLTAFLGDLRMGDFGTRVPDGDLKTLWGRPIRGDVTGFSSMFRTGDLTSTLEPVSQVDAMQLFVSPSAEALIFNLVLAAGED